MIEYFPNFYTDELVYSLLARVYVQGGYVAYRYCAEELFSKPLERPDIEFVNSLTAAASDSITRDMTMEQVVLNHTMFPYYARFLPLERRSKAFHAMVSMQGNYNNLLPMPKSKNGAERHLRYCPMCAAIDREQYGETYWHRTHQMQGVNICPIHFCYLVESDVLISGKASPSLTAADEVIPMETQVKLSDNSTERGIAGYVSEVFQTAMDLKSDVLVGDYLHGRMDGTKYKRSVRGEHRNIALFASEFAEYYKGLPDNWFTELWQIQKVFTNCRFGTYEVCMIAMFLDIPISDLAHMELPQKPQQQIFDEQIRAMHENGMKYPEIANRLGASYDTVKAIGEKKHRQQKADSRNHKKCGAKPKDWMQIDENTLPLVKEAIDKLYGDGEDRPKKVTIAAVEKMLNLPSGRIHNYLPICRAEIQKYHESQEQYWAREVMWAVKKIQREGDVLNWKHIRDLTNMRRCDLTACAPYFTDEQKQTLNHILNP